jgi:gamma-glutamylcyclotransferase (GGCT)/AIG2-like uncharacterized protein YtfP
MSYQTEEKLPFFVYGTLRSGQSNFYLLDGRTQRIRSAYVDGYALYCLGTYPSMLPYDTPRARVYGEVVTPMAHRYEAVMQALDRLEDYDPANPDASWYYRITHDVHLNASRTVRAWLYLGREEHLKMWHKRIPGGDWSQFCQQNDIQPFAGRNPD